MTTFYQKKNNAYSTLLASINNSQTTLTVQVSEASRFPASGSFPITVWYAIQNIISCEIMLCTSRSANTLTVVRNQEGTSAQAWDITLGTVNVWMNFTAAVSQQEDTAINALEGKFPVQTSDIGNTQVTYAKISPLDKILLIQQVDQTLVDNVSLPIAYGTSSESYKVGSITHSTVTNNSRVTIGTTGKYRLTGSVRYSGGNTSNRFETSFYINGSTAVGGMSVPASSTSLFVTATAEYLLNSGDYIELLGFQHTGGDITAQTEANQTFLSVSLMP